MFDRPWLDFFRQNFLQNFIEIPVSEFMRTFTLRFHFIVLFIALLAATYSNTGFCAEAMTESELKTLESWLNESEPHGEKRIGQRIFVIESTEDGTKVLKRKLFGKTSKKDKNNHGYEVDKRTQRTSESNPEHFQSELKRVFGTNGLGGTVSDAFADKTELNIEELKKALNGARKPQTPSVVSEEPQQGLNLALETKEQSRRAEVIKEEQTASAALAAQLGEAKESLNRNQLEKDEAAERAALAAKFEEANESLGRTKLEKEEAAARADLDRKRMTKTAADQPPPPPDAGDDDRQSIHSEGSTSSAATSKAPSSVNSDARSSPTKSQATSASVARSAAIGVTPRSSNPPDQSGSPRLTEQSLAALAAQTTEQARTATRAPRSSCASCPPAPTPVAASHSCVSDRKVDGSLAKWDFPSNHLPMFWDTKIGDQTVKVGTWNVLNEESKQDYIGTASADPRKGSSKGGQGKAFAGTVLRKMEKEVRQDAILERITTALASGTDILALQEVHTDVLAKLTEKYSNTSPERFKVIAVADTGTKSHNHRVMIIDSSKFVVPAKKGKHDGGYGQEIQLTPKTAEGIESKKDKFTLINAQVPPRQIGGLKTQLNHIKGPYLCLGDMNASRTDKSLPGTNPKKGNPARIEGVSKGLGHHAVAPYDSAHPFSSINTRGEPVDYDHLISKGLGTPTFDAETHKKLVHTCTK